MRRKGRAGCGCVIVVVALVAGVALTVAVPLSVLAFGSQLAALAHRIFVLPVLQVEATLIALSPLPRIALFGVWLSLTLVTGYALAKVLGKRIRYDTVASVFLVSIASVIVAGWLTSWLMYALLGFLRLRPDS